MEKRLDKPGLVFLVATSSSELPDEEPEDEV